MCSPVLLLPVLLRFCHVFVGFMFELRGMLLESVTQGFKREHTMVGRTALLCMWYSEPTCFPADEIRWTTHESRHI